ncbi:MAG: hypothetical protein ACRELV_03660 [Longimicrobiales bacterium]
MITREDLEGFLFRIAADVEEVDDGMWVTRAPEQGAIPVVVHFSPPVVLLRLKVLDLPAEGDGARLASFYRKLLELNATDIVHGSYGIDGNDVLLSDALELETLDFHELQSSYESMLMAASTHTQSLVELVPVPQEN